MAGKIGICDKHRMAIYELADGTIFNSCGHCAPPSKDPKNKRLPGYRHTHHEEFCTDETLDSLKKGPYRLTFQVPPWAEDEFFNDYLECAGEPTEFGMPGVHRSNAKTLLDKCWYSARIESPEDHSHVFASRYSDRIKPSQTEGWVSIYCIHFAGFLLAHGFRPGFHEGGIGGSNE